MDKNSSARAQQLKALASQWASRPAVDIDHWLANKPARFGDIMRNLIAAEQARQNSAWAEKCAAFNPHVLASYCRKLTMADPARAAVLLPLIEHHRFKNRYTQQAGHSLPAIPTPQH